MEVYGESRKELPMRIHSSTSATRGKDLFGNDALTLLSADHQSVTELFDLFEAALESSSSEQKSLCVKICGELEIHTHLEEEIFYPTISQDAKLRPLVTEALTDHANVKAQIQKIRNLHVEDPQFGSSMLQLMDDVEKHIDEEENVMFAEVEKRFSGELDALGLQIAQRKQELSDHMSTSMSESNISKDGPVF